MSMESITCVLKELGGAAHPHGPTDPDVTVSRHPALIIQPPG